MGLSSTVLSEVVCDAGPLIHLDELEQLALLADFQTVWVPNQVKDEIRQILLSLPQRSTLYIRRRFLEQIIAQLEAYQ